MLNLPHWPLSSQSRARLGVEPGQTPSRVREGVAWGLVERSADGSRAIALVVQVQLIRPKETQTRRRPSKTWTMDYEAYQPDSTSRVKSGYAYRVLGHDAATYYQYAIYVSALLTTDFPPAAPWQRDEPNMNKPRSNGQ